MSLFSFGEEDLRLFKRLIFLLTLLVTLILLNTSLVSAPASEEDRSVLREKQSREKQSKVVQLVQADRVRNVVAPQKTKKSSYAKQVTLRNAHVVTILSGDYGSTDARLAADIANALDKDEGDEPIRVVPYMGRGGVHNLKDLLFLKGVDMAIVSQGQLGFIELEDPELFTNIRENIQYLSKIYNAELQILANKKIKNITELAGKRVVFGKKLGPTPGSERH